MTFRAKIKRDMHVVYPTSQYQAKSFVTGTSLIAIYDYDENDTPQADHPLLVGHGGVH